MTNYVPTESSTTTSVNLDVENDSFAFVGAGITIGSTDNAAAFLTSNSIIHVDGTLVGEDAIFANGAGSVFEVGAGGLVWGQEGGLVVDDNHNTMTNAGTIFGGSVGLEVENADGDEIHNSGTITGGRGGDPVDGNGALLFFGDDGAKISLTNSGLIQTQLAGSFAVHSSGAAVDTIVNTGTMRGNVSLEGGNDRLDTSHGTLVGTINMGDGNDTVLGSAGSDTVLGGIGNDLLVGNAGNDKLTGGAGADVMTGGVGADSFIFSNSDTGITAGTEDRITDFTHAQADRLDLHLIDANMSVANDQGFTFIGTTGFHARAGELNYTVVGGNAFVSGDVTGDGHADFTIRLDHVTTLTAADFIL